MAFAPGSILISISCVSLPHPLPEPDGEGTEMHHDGGSLVQELSRPGQVARHQWKAAPIQDEDAACAAIGVVFASPVTAAGAGLPSHNLTTHVALRPVSCLTQRVRRRTFEGLELRKHPRVSRQRMVQGRLDGVFSVLVLVSMGSRGFRPLTPSLQGGVADSSFDLNLACLALA